MSRPARRRRIHRDVGHRRGLRHRGDLRAACGIRHRRRDLPVLHRGERLPERSALPDVLRAIREVRDAGSQQEGVGRAEPGGSGGDEAGRRRYPAAFRSAGVPRGPEAHPALPAGRRARPAYDGPARRAGPEHGHGSPGERGRRRRGTADPGAAGNRSAAGCDRGAARMPGRGRRGDRDGDPPGPDSGPRPSGRRQDTAGHLRGDRHGGGLPGRRPVRRWLGKGHHPHHLPARRRHQPRDPVPRLQRPGPLTGHYVVKGDEVTFYWNPTPTWVSAPETVRWSYFDGQLTFAIVDVADTASRVIYTAHPWRKTG